MKFLNILLLATVATQTMSLQPMGQLAQQMTQLRLNENKSEADWDLYSQQHRIESHLKYKNDISQSIIDATPAQLAAAGILTWFITKKIDAINKNPYFESITIPCIFDSAHDSLTQNHKELNSLEEVLQNLDNPRLKFVITHPEIPYFNNCPPAISPGGNKFALFTPYRDKVFSNGAREAIDPRKRCTYITVYDIQSKEWTEFKSHLFYSLRDYEYGDELYDKAGRCLLNDTERGAPNLFPEKIYASPITFSPNGNLIVSATDTTQVGFCDLTQKDTILPGALIIYDFLPDRPKSPPYFSPDGNYLAFIMDDETTLVFNLQTKRKTAGRITTKHEVCALAFSPDSTQLALGTTCGKIKILNLKTSESSKYFDTILSSIGLITFSPDSKHLLFAGGRIEVMNLKTKKSYVLGGHISPVTSIKFLGDPNFIITTASDFYSDGTIKIWNLKARKSYILNTPKKLPSCDCEFSTLYKSFITSTARFSILLWKPVIEVE